MNISQFPQESLTITMFYSAPDAESFQFQGSGHDPIWNDQDSSRYRQAFDGVRRCVEGQTTDGQAAENSFEYLMSHDRLTGLLNRDGFFTHLKMVRAASAEDHQPLGVLILDLDHFSAINEGLGMASGDEVLRHVAERLIATVNSSAVLARLSSDEFVVLDNFNDSAAACGVATEILAAISRSMDVEGGRIQLTASIGFAMVSKEDTPDGLMSRTASAVDRAKRRGRNRCEVGNVDLDHPNDGWLKRRRELQRAVDDGELRLFFQPQIDLVSGQMNGFEALVRWDHPNKGLLAPSAFIDFAEESGLILPLGAWVINAAVAQQAAWHRSAAGRPPVRMSVNISAIQLSDPRLEEMVTEALERHGVAPGLLTLEITETALTADPVAALRTLEILKALGVRLAIDDFGTGHSSLTYLKRFPIDELKIDRSFIAGLTTDSKDHAIVASCIQLAHATNLIAVAEGVEMPAQLHALTELDCDLAQGYFYTRPMSAEDLEPWFIPRPDNMRLGEPQLVGQ